MIQTQPSCAAQVQPSRVMYMLVITLTFLVTILLIGLTSNAAHADTYPDRPINIIVPFPPGGANDIVARVLAPKLSSAVGQPVIIENKGGAGGTIGAASVARAKPDGYTLLMTAVPFVITQSLYSKLPYDGAKDFTPITLLTNAPFLLAASPSLDVQSLSDLLALAKAQPGKVTFSSPGNGSPAHLAGELINKRSGVKMMHVPYKGGGPAVADVVAGHISFTLATSAEIMPFASQGRLRVIGATSKNRISFLPEIATLHESGLPNYEISVWYGISAPTGTPRNVIDLLNKELNAIIKQPDVQERLKVIGMESSGTTAGQFGEFLRLETTKWGQLVRDSGAKVE